MFVTPTDRFFLEDDPELLLQKNSWNVTFEDTERTYRRHLVLLALILVVVIFLISFFFFPW